MRHEIQPIIGSDIVTREEVDITGGGRRYREQLHGLEVIAQSPITQTIDQQGTEDEIYDSRPLAQWSNLGGDNYYPW